MTEPQPPAQASLGDAIVTILADKRVKAVARGNSPSAVYFERLKSQVKALIESRFVEGTRNEADLNAYLRVCLLKLGYVPKKGGDKTW